MLVIEGLGEVGLKLKPVQARGQNGGLLCRQIGVDFVRHEGFFPGPKLCALILVCALRERKSGCRVIRSGGVEGQAGETVVMSTLDYQDIEIFPWFTLARCKTPCSRLAEKNCVGGEGRCTRQAEELVVISIEAGTKCA